MPSTQQKWLTVRELSEHEHILHNVDFSMPDPYDLGEEGDPTVQHEASQSRSAAHLETANVFSSRLLGQQIHTVAVDVDHRVRVVESSTSGHYHLYIDVPMPWPKYLKLLEALAEAGIVEPGYVEASRRREATHLRLPWVKKDPVEQAQREALIEQHQLNELEQGRIVDDDSAAREIDLLS